MTPRGVDAISGVRGGLALPAEEARPAETPFSADKLQEIQEFQDPASHLEFPELNAVPMPTAEERHERAASQKEVDEFMNFFLDGDEEEICVADDEPEYIEVEAAADSGAGDNVASRVDVPGFQVKESEGSRRGQQFKDAGGHRMKNEGEVHLRMEAPGEKEGTFSPVDTVFQIADVCRPLMAVSRMCDKGDNTVTFDTKKAVVRNAKGQIICVFKRQGNLYVARMKIKNPRWRDFHRQGS